MRNDLSRLLRTPNTLQESIPLRQSVHAVVTLGPRSHESAERIRLVLACVSAVLVDLADGDLHAGVVLGFDDSVGCGAFSGDVAVSVRLVCESSCIDVEMRGRW